MRYVDGFVIPLPKKNMKAYVKIAQAAGKVWKEHGALEYLECAIDDENMNFGIPFPMIAKVKKGETVVFSFVVYKSKAHRDSVNAKVMKDERITSMMEGKKSPFDMKRMTYGGFKALVDL